MGTLCTIRARGPGAKAAVDAAFREIQRINDFLSNYVEDSELSQLNRAGHARPGPEFMSFLELSLRYAKETGGAFDITVGAAVEAWGFRDRKYRVPGREELARLVPDGDRMHLGRDGVKLDKGVKLDPGAIGKGYAVDRAVEILRKAGVTEALVDFGSVVYGFGKDWTAGVRDPFHPKRILGTVTLNGGALAVSGNTEIYFEKDGRRYGHILDPRTARPIREIAGTAVLSQTAVEADVYSTAIFVDPALAEGRAALVIPDDPNLPHRATPAWKKRFRER